MPRSRQFATLFRLALLALGLSKARAAALLQVDKSLVGRWASGAGGREQVRAPGAGFRVNPTRDLSSTSGRLDLSLSLK